MKILLKIFINIFFLFSNKNLKVKENIIFNNNNICNEIDMRKNNGYPNCSHWNIGLHI